MGEEAAVIGKVKALVKGWKGSGGAAEEGLLGERRKGQER